MRGKIAILVITLACAAAADAQDACLTGDSTLGDQRALAALRAATETYCACASYPAPRGRRDYRRCTSQQTNAAIAAAALRRECQRTARLLYRGATCGTNRVACGAVKLSDGSLRCRLASTAGANECDGSARIAESECSGQTYCTDVVDWTAATCVDPRARGPYNVGVRTVPYTKDSVVSPGTPRALDTVIWYPTTADAAPINNALGGVVDAPVDVSGGPYPLLMFSHGSCGYPAQSTFLTPLIASYGYVVAAPPHPGNTIFEFPNCAAGIGASFQERPQDIIFVTDELLAANADATSPFFAAIDPQRIGMSGHSFGGLTTYLVQGIDARFRVAVPMAAAAFANSALTVPSLTMLGAIDSVVNNDANRQAYQNSSAPKLKVEVEHAGHYAFSNGCFPSPDCNPPATTTQDESHAAVLRWVLPFLQRYLAGDESYEPFLNAVPPGVRVEQSR
jgi:predicted dienelactone hydrolase